MPVFAALSGHRKSLRLASYQQETSPSSPHLSLEYF
jgi:hypothetical protein